MNERSLLDQCSFLQYPAYRYVKELGSESESTVLRPCPVTALIPISAPSRKPTYNVNRLLFCARLGKAFPKFALSVKTNEIKLSAVEKLVEPVKPINAVYSRSRVVIFGKDNSEEGNVPANSDEYRSNGERGNTHLGWSRFRLYGYSPVQRYSR